MDAVRSPPPLNGRAPNRVWAMLAAYNIPYWLSQTDWLALFGTDAQGRCAVTSRPALVDGLAVPLGFKPGRAGDPAFPPDTLTASCQRHPTSEANLAALVDRLTALLGPGKELAPSNHIGVSWTFGPAYITAHAHPPELNQPYLDGEPYASNPALRTQAILTICPGWLPDATPPQHAALAQYQPISEDAPGAPSRYGHARAFLRWPVDLPLPQGGFGTAGPGHVAIIERGRTVQLIPTADVTCIELLVRHPARTAGDCTLTLKYRHGGGDARMALGHCQGADPGPLAPLATEFAAAAGIKQTRVDVPAD